MATDLKAFKQCKEESKPVCFYHDSSMMKIEFVAFEVNPDPEPKVFLFNVVVQNLAKDINDVLLDV